MYTTKQLKNSAKKEENAGENWKKVKNKVTIDEEVKEKLGQNEDFF